MRRFFLGLALLAITGAPVSATAKSSLEGRWKNGKMEIVIHPCGRTLCGTVVKASPKQQAKAQSGSGTSLIGARVIDNIRPAGSGTFKANVFVADRDVTARGTIRQVNADRLNVRGCVISLICKTTNWDRVGR
jgi:uncharacterized protein (DUF2147 family)